MTSYASQPTPGWSASGPEPPPAEVSPPREDGEPAPGGEWQTGPQADWHSGTQGRWPGQAAGPQPDQGPGHGPARELRSGPMRDQVPAGALWAGKLRDQAPAREQRPGQLTGRWTGLAGRPRRNSVPEARFPPEARPSAGIAAIPADCPAQRSDPGHRSDPEPHEPGQHDDLGDPGDRRAILSYLGVPFLGFLPPLAVYLITLRGSRSTRRHAAQALNLSITVILYSVCALILGGLLALDTVPVALLITVPLLAVLWIVALVYLVLAGVAASRGEYYQIPGWLCATLVR